jgi:hypothetical protein
VALVSDLGSNATQSFLSCLRVPDVYQCVQPTSVIAQKPIADMMDAVPHNLLPTPHGRTSSASVQSVPRKVMSRQDSSGGQTAPGTESNPPVQSHSLTGLHSYSWRSPSLCRSEGRESARSIKKGSPRPLGEHGEVSAMQILDDEMKVDSEVTLSLQCSTSNGRE